MGADDILREASRIGTGWEFSALIHQIDGTHMDCAECIECVDGFECVECDEAFEAFEAFGGSENASSGWLSGDSSSDASDENEQHGLLVNRTGDDTVEPNKNEDTMIQSGVPRARQGARLRRQKQISKSVNVLRRLQKSCFDDL